MTHGGPYFQHDHIGRGLALGDLNNDGRPDLVVSHLNEPVTILRNIQNVKNHWLGVALEAKEHADVVGARLVLQVGTKKLTMFAKGGGSYLSSPDRRILFGLGDSRKVGRLTVYWPAGEPRKQTWSHLKVDRYHRLVQGEKEARPFPRLKQLH